MRWQDAEEVECIGLLHIAHGACHLKYYLVFKKYPLEEKRILTQQGQFQVSPFLALLTFNLQGVI